MIQRLIQYYDAQKAMTNELSQIMSTCQDGLHNSSDIMRYSKMITILIDNDIMEYISDQHNLRLIELTALIRRATRNGYETFKIIIDAYGKMYCRFSRSQDGPGFKFVIA